MKIDISEKKNEFKKEQNKLDRFVMQLTSLMNKLNQKFKLQILFQRYLQ